MRLLKRSLKLRQKFILLSSSLLAISLLGLSLTVYFSQRAYILEQNEIRLTSHLEDISSLLDLQIKEKQEQVNLALSVANHLTFQRGELRQVDTLMLDYKAIHQLTKEETQVSLPAWYVGETLLQNDFTLVDQIMELTGQTATIFQKIDEGYLRISTNVQKKDGSRAVGTFIPNDSEVIKTVERGETFRGRAYVVNAWYVTAYQPIYLNGEVKGILYVGVKEKDIEFLKEKFHAKTFWESGYPYALTGEGEMLIHPNYEGEDLSEVSSVAQIIDLKEGTLNLEWGGEQGQAMVHSFVYYPFYNMILGIAVPRYELIEGPLAKLRNLVFGGFVIALLFSFTVFYLYLARQLKPLEMINDRLKLVAQRKALNTEEVRRHDEIGEIRHSLNQLVEGNNKVTAFANAIGKGEFETDFEALGQDDLLGNSLLQMRDELKQVAAEDKKRAWSSEGFSRFLNLLRNKQSDLKLMTNALLPELIKYLEANQGAIFIYQEESEDAGRLELSAMYAWNRTKTMEQHILIRGNEAEGLLGQAFLEREPIYLTDVPENFVRITSGLGEANPGCILIQPLIYNEQVYGVMEIASFRPFDEHERAFVNRLSESIASSIASLKVNAQTMQLLQESKLKTEEITAKEEELRQNMEEMQATNEEMRRKESGYLQQIQQLKNELEGKPEQS
ncbi:MAG: Cache 3/Cache 2 fusion domain-containing protein [Cyclobacteriaceae bacterium]